MRVKVIEWGFDDELNKWIVRVMVGKESIYSKEFDKESEAYEHYRSLTKETV